MKKPEEFDWRLEEIVALRAEVEALRKAAMYTVGRLQMDIDDGGRPDQWSMLDIVMQHREALALRGEGEKP